jgi:hypothetical protein
MAGGNNYLFLFILLEFINYIFMDYISYFLKVFVYLGPWWRSWLRHYATNWKVAGSIPNGVIGIFHWHNPFGRTVALESTQPLTETSTRNISWGVNVAGAYG